MLPAGWESYNLHSLAHIISWVGAVLYINGYTDFAQHITTAGYDLSDISADDLSVDYLFGHDPSDVWMYPKRTGLRYKKRGA